MPEKKEMQLWNVIMTWVLRILVGSVFIFSGFVKSIDVWGTLYKVEDYIGVMGFEIRPNLIMVGSFALCMVEFVLGVFLILGCFRKSVPVLLAIFMAFMLPLTLWIALFNPVADCGCFGEAFLISNWATFWKNIAISAALVWLLRYNRKIHWIITPSLQWICFIATALYITIIALIGYYDQPMFDFRPFKTGTMLTGAEAQGPYVPEYIFIYEKNGERKEFAQDDEMPDESSGWIFVDRKEVSWSSDAGNADNSIYITDKDGVEVSQAEVIRRSGAEFVLFMPSLGDLSIASSYKINSLYSWAKAHGVGMVAITGGQKQDVDRWEDISMSQYPVYLMDDTVIKMIVRGNPALVYIEDGRIRWKRALRSIPIDDFMDNSALEDPMSLAVDSMGILCKLSLMYVAILAVLVMLSFLPKIKHFFDKKKEGQRVNPENAVKNDDKVLL